MKRGLQLAAIVLGLAALAWKWHSLHDVVAAIDHGDLLFADFVHHYYPTVEPPLRTGHPAGGFFYPAGFAVLLAPIGWLSLHGAEIVWGIVQLGCVLWAATVLTSAAAPGRPWLAALGALGTVTSVAVLHNLKWGQVSIVLLASAGGAFLCWRTRPNLAAALLGIAAGIKGYPLVFVGWFVLRGELRFVLRAAIACFVTLVVLPVVFMGPEHALFFQRVSTGAVLGAADGVLRDFNSQYAPAVLARFYEGGWDRAPVEAIAWARLGSGAAIALIAVLAAVTARSNAPRLAKQRDLLGLVLVTSSVPFWLRTSWSHYFVHLTFAQVLLAGLYAGRGRARDLLAVALLVAPSAYLTSVLALFDTEGWWYYANAGSLFFANALVLVAATAFIGEEHVRSLRGARGSSVTGPSPSALR